MTSPRTAALALQNVERQQRERALTTEAALNREQPLARLRDRECRDVDRTAYPRVNGSPARIRSGSESIVITAHPPAKIGGVVTSSAAATNDPQAFGPSGTSVFVCLSRGI